MPREPRRYQLERALVYHIINRGIIRQTIFHDDEDRVHFIGLIKRYKDKFIFKVYHWAIMGNHYHLVLDLGQPKELSKIIGPIQQIYALYYHRRYNTAGQLFQSRYKSQAIERGNYLLACGRYVERNPVRAGIAKVPWEYKSSSAMYYVLNERDGITEDNPEWKGSGGDKEDYKKWLMSDKAQEEESIFRSDAAVIGSEEFKKRLVVSDGRMYPRMQGRPRG